MARKLAALFFLCVVMGCSAHKSSVVSRLTIEETLPATHKTYRPDMKAKLEVEMKREW